jgi:hypothetical protein
MVVLRNNGQICASTSLAGVDDATDRPRPAKRETIREIDYRPATGELTGLKYRAHLHH